MDNLENDLKVFQNLSVPHIESKLNQIKVYFEKLTFNSQQRDEYIQIIFCKEHGLIAFILRNLSKSNYTKANNDALEVIYTIINSFPLQTWRYGEDLVNLTRTILMFYKLDYRIYCKSFNIIEKLVKMKGAEKFVADLYDQLYAKLNNLHQSAQVKKQYYKTLGLIIRNHYEIINLKQEILQSLQQNICKAYSNASYLEMEGMISCLSDCLICMEVNETNSFVNVIYPIFKEIITMQLKIRTLPRSVFEFFQNHISIFGKNLFDCQWYHIFNTWSSYTDENAKVAFNMALIYFRFLSLYNISDDNDLIYKDTIKFYVENYKDLILEERAIGFERHLAIRAYGFLAKPYAFLVNSAIEDHNKIMNFIKKNHEKDMKYMGSYISTVSELISIEFAEEKFEFMIILISKLVRNFPTVNNTYCINDIAEALHNIWKVDPKRYDYMLKNIIFEGIQWTCSHDVVDEQTKYVDESVITYLNYLPFWEGLLKNLSNSVDENTSETFYKDFCRELIYTKLKLIYKLNLDIVYEEADTFTQSNIKAKQQYDFNIFVNMIDLYSNLLPLVNQAQIKPYIISSIKHFVKLSVKYPLVIGFYKILIIWLRIASRANYFSAKRVEQRHDLQKVCALLSSFAYDVLLQLKEFGENLQTTCLELIVLLPTRVLKDHLPMVTLQMIVILKCERVGDTIDAVIDALENLCSEFAMSEISPYIRQVLPHLDAYLRNSSTDWTNSTIKWNRKSMTSLQKRRVRIESDTVMYRLQKRIVKFIGKLSSELCIAFAEDTSTIKPISRNKSNHLQLNLAYGNKDVVFPLDELLPSIIQLTRVCNDRKTKFAACELLHCITTLILQKNVSECEDGRRLLENVIFTVLLLGCDVDEELSKIFYHFFMQIIHWYTKPNASKNDVEVLLDALMIGVTSETNSSLRTFSGLCLQEFLLWTKKQKTSKSRLIDDPYFVFIVDKIEQFNMHSDAHKRLGSAIIFNSIYRILREDDDLINTYWIKLLYIFISSLSTTDLVGDDKYFQQITFALDHLKRVFVHPSKRALFNTTNQDRILPVPFKGSTLNDVARWLFETYATSSAPSTRDACIRFFDAIVPHVINYRNLETFLNDNNIQFPNQTDLFCSLTDVSFANEQKHDNLVRWLNDFRKITDFYYTAVAQSLALDLNQSFMEAFATFTGILINNESLLINDVQQRKCLKSLQFSTTVNILKLAAAFLETNNNRVLNVHAFFGRTYCKFLLHCIIKMKDIAWSYDLNRLESLLNQIAQLHGYYKSDLFDSEFRNEIDSYKINDELRKDMDSYTCTRRYVQMLKGIVFMQKTALNDFVKIDLQFREIIGNDRNAEPNESVNLKWAITLKNCTDVCELIDCLMDANETSDQVESLNNFRKYQAGILNFLLGHFDTGVSYLLEKYHDITRDIVVYLNDLMIYLSENVEQIQGITTEDLLCALLQCWPKLTPYFHKNTTSLNQGVTLLRNVISLIGNKGDALNNISSWIMSRFPADNDINLEQYLKISSVLLTLFPYMTRPQNEEAELRVYQSIKWKILEKDLASDDIRFIHVFLMDINEVLYASPSLNFLKFVFEIFAKCAAANDINLENALKSYLRNIDNDLQVHILEFTYEMCNDRLNYSIEERYKVGKIAFSHLLHHSSLSAIETFFVKMIPRIKSRIATNVLFNNDDEIIEAIINLIVIENLFVHFDYDTHDFINKPFKMACIKRCYGVPRETENLTGVDANYLRLYNCHAYNALASIVCNMKKERQDKHYDMLIPYNTTTLNRLFHKEAYSFDYDASEAVTYKRIFTVVREDLMKNRKSIDASSKTPIYVESMSLFKSSLLVGSFAKYDFSHANIREEGIDNGNSRSDIMLNVDIINNHECMSTCCMIIRQAYESMEIMEVTPSMSLPKWAENVRCILISDIHSNLCKIFLVKMVYNVKDVFEPFAAHFLEPVINVILTCFGDKITSLTTESILMIISWGVLDSSRGELAQKLINFLVANVHHHNNAILKSNVSMVRTILELCKGYVAIEYENVKNIIDKKHGVIISNVALVNSVPLWTNQQDCESFGNDLLLRLKIKQMQLPVAECLGHYLNFINAKCTDLAHKIQEKLADLLQQIKTDDRIKLLQRLSVGFPFIVHNHVYLITTISNKKCLHKREILSILINAADIFKGSIYFNNFIDTIDEIFNENAIDVKSDILKLIKLLTVSGSDMRTVAIIMKVLDKHHRSFNDTCRTEMYEILINIHEHCNQNMDDRLSKEIIQTCRRIVLLSLAECNRDFDKRFLALWQTDVLNPADKNFARTFADLINSLYFPRIENKYLNYLAYFLLNALQNSTHVTGQLATNSEEVDDHSKLLNLNGTSRNRLSSNPMFDYGFTFKRPDDPERIAATQALQFSNTLNDARSVKVGSRPQETIKSTKYILLPNSRTYRQSAITATQVSNASKDAVKIYRQYRSDEMPNFSIKLFDVLELMQLVSMRDVQFAAAIFRATFDTLLDSTEDDANDLFIAMNKNLVSSELFVPSFVEAYLNVALVHKNKFDVKFSADVLSRACLNSGLLAVGTLLYEQYIIDEETEEPSIKKPKTEANSYWVRLAQIYREMNESDIASSILCEKINCNQMVLKAIDAEANGYWRRAKLHYEGALKGGEGTNEELELCYEPYFKSLARLSEWKDLCIAVDPSGSNGSNVCEYLLGVDKEVFRWYLTANVRLSVTDGKKKAKLLSEINTILQNKELSEYFKIEFGEEIAFLMVTECDLDLSKIYVNKCINNFLATWYHIDPLLVALRSKKLLNIQLIVDIENLLSGKTFHEKIDHWKVTSNDNINNIIDVEKRCFYRQEMLNCLKKIDREDSDNDIFELKLSLDKNLIKASIKENNYHVAESARLRMSDNIRYHSNEENLELSYLTNQIIHLKFRLCSSDKIDFKRNCLREMLKTYNDHLNVPSIKNDLVLMLTVSYHLFDIANEIDKLGTELLSALDATDSAIFRRAFNAAELSVETVRNGAVANLKERVNYCRDELENLMGDDHEEILASIAKSFYKLAVYAKDRMDNGTLIDCTLLSMYYGSDDGRQLFPCILTIENLNDFAELFHTEHAQRLPTWLFLKWLPQLLSNLCANEAPPFESILFKIVDQYPQAIAYHYPFMRERYKRSSGNCRSNMDALMLELDQSFASNLSMDTFFKALSAVTVPDVVFECNMKKLLKSVDVNFQTVLDEVIHDFFSVSNVTQDCYNIRGDVWLNLHQLEKDFQDLIARPNDRTATLEAIVNKYVKSHQPKRLSSYSPWLANVHDLKDIEVPGQYTGDTLPLMQYHAKIYSFSSWVDIFHSKCRPIKITINSHDGKEYPFLLKYGEDLRQDQRIEQLFGVMNDTFRNDKDCEYRRLSIRRYEVVPLTEKFGMIQFIKNTVKLREFLCDSVKQQTLIDIQTQHKNWLSKALPVGESDYMQYAYSYTKYNPEATVRKMTELINLVPSDSLRKSMWRISKDPTSFVALRRKLVTSYSVQCICNWILGIGDRHLDNTLFCIDTGRSIPIDFGLAFGVATQFQTVPELVPIRLTPQLLNLMEPLNEHGYYERTMVYALKALRSNVHVLLATMDVFVKEPTIDWLVHVEGLQKTITDSNRWSPSGKIRQVEEKLDGSSSVSITIQDLGSRVGDRAEAKSKLIEYVRANLDPTTVDERHLEVSDQVKFLIRHATDRNLLGRMYAGWEPWL